jgi:2-(1,2-epoxy-1,2-dihydrophenyl)acetyl-CoA isomerase
MAKTSTSILRTARDGVLILSLNRPERANAFNYEMTQALLDGLKDAARDPDVRCLVLTGTGNSFSAGQDLGEIEQAGEVSYRAHLQQTYNPLIIQLRRLEKPVLAALKGGISGAALGIALACDIRIAATDANFRVGFLGIGLVPDSAVSLLLPAVVGLGVASEMVFTNHSFDAQSALKWGLVNHVVALDALEDHTLDYAVTLAHGPLRTIGLTKRAFNYAMLPNLDDVLDYEAHLQEIAKYGDEHKEGVQAFLEKRPPEFL